MNSEIKPILVGGIGEKNYGKQYRQGNRVYDSNSIAMACLSSPIGNAGGYSYLYLVEEKNMDNIKEKIICEQRCDEGLRFFKDNICGSLRTIDACGDKRVLEIATATAMRGRNNEDGKCEQRLEISDREYANAITTVQKDSLVAEVEKNINENATIIREEPLKREGWHRNATEVLSVDGICRTLSTQSNNLATKIKEQPSLRIRKLTPLECFRLQGFDDDSFRRAEKVNSNSQLYKQAGNSICVPVIQYILQNLFECGVLNIE